MLATHVALGGALVQDVVLDKTPKASTAFVGRQHLTLTGTLEYQACDDRLCFNPVSVPLSCPTDAVDVVRASLPPGLARDVRAARAGRRMKNCQARASDQRAAG